VCLVDQASIGKRKKIIVDALGDNEGSMSSCCHIDDEGNLSTSSVSVRERQTSSICSVSK